MEVKIKPRKATDRGGYYCMHFIPTSHKAGGGGCLHSVPSVV